MALHDNTIERSDLDLRLRLIDLTFECMEEASAAFPRQGPMLPGERHVSNPERMALFNRLRTEAMEREGIPAELLGDGKTANQRHFETMAREFGR